MNGQETENKNFNFNTYGIFRAHLAIFDGQAEIQDASPRVGFKMDYRFGKDNRFTIFLGGEFAVNLIDNQFNFQADPNNNKDGFSNLKFNESKSTFSTRLGYLGINLHKFGSLTIGKQNSVYKSVAGQTDIFNVMSGQASYVFSPETTDGGETGTGRAESAVIYRNTIKKLNIGLQSQFRAKSYTFFDSYGISLSYPVLQHLFIGTAFLKDFIHTAYEEQGLKGNPTYFTAGLSYHNGPIYISGVFAHQKNGDFVNVVHPEIVQTIFYGGTGYELVASYTFMKKRLKIMTGFNYKDPDTDDHLILNDNFRKRLYLIGMQYRFIKYASIYSEYKYEDSINELGKKEPSVFMVGLRLDFNKTWNKNIDLRLD